MADVADSATLRALAAAFEPVLYFSTGELFFPIQVESWLTHASAADWQASSGLDVAAESPAGPVGRGTAVLGGDGTKLSRAPTAGGDALGPTEIGEARFTGAAAQDTYLTFGGWSGPDRASGCRDYLYAAFSDLASAMDPANLVMPFARLPNEPTIWAGQPTTPTVYAEAELAGRLLPSGVTDAALDRLLAVTYHYFFALRDEAGPPAGYGPAEGQWESVTVFFRGTPSAVKGHGDRTRFAYRAGTPLTDWFVPHGVVTSTPGPVGEAAARWEAVFRLGNHPMLVVARGSHRLLLRPRIGEDTAFVADHMGPADPGAADVTRLPVDDPGREGGFFGDPPTNVLLGLALALALPIAAIVVIAARLFFGARNDKPAGDAHEPGPVAPRPYGNGGGSVARPADGTTPPGSVVQNPSGEFWDVSRVDDPALTVLRFVDRFTPAPRAWWSRGEDGAAPPTTETPPWWDYPGRWGVVPTPLSSWAPGTRRTDATGRSLAWAAVDRLRTAWATSDSRLPRRP